MWLGAVFDDYATSPLVLQAGRWTRCASSSSSSLRSSIAQCVRGARAQKTGMSTQFFWKLIAAGCLILCSILSFETTVDANQVKEDSATAKVPPNANQQQETWVVADVYSANEALASSSSSSSTSAAEASALAQEAGEACKMAWLPRATRMWYVLLSVMLSVLLSSGTTNTTDFVSI